MVSGAVGFLVLAVDTQPSAVVLRHSAERLMQRGPAMTAPV